MSKLAVRRRPMPMLGDFAELWNAFAPNVAPFGAHLIRVEDSMDDGRYVVRAELPGMDLADVDVSVQNGRLTIKAERTEKHEEKGRSEFSYGSFERTVTLPAGADEDGIDASYAQGILTVSVPLAEEKDLARKVEIKNGE
ncbi:Hsp20/alpha crystallin family protein [Nocardia pseudobrasiliensis]|uniref:HSP20 family molecular chaperone IbpA n=1 Tax=Nocardia pseudobrasiliensis TaxID=45979 RepID=A0A370IC67_9NOCA|nr:Hsp20/alpha crystallin family protein [Nocardia pseudobrasiliensis]RDI68297.1 HSP20 family molecular chaperone IbpA [Nocardia pseudobrasiliensis]